MNTTTFQELYHAHRPQLAAGIRQMTRHQAQADDLMASTFAIAWARRDTFRGKSAFNTWLFAIAQNELRNAWRHEKLIQIVPLDNHSDSLIAESDNVSEGCERSGVCLRMRQIIHGIPRHYRGVLKARYLRRESIPEIARQYGIPYGTVLSRLFKARQLLRESLGAQDE